MTVVATKKAMPKALLVMEDTDYEAVTIVTTDDGTVTNIQLNVADDVPDCLQPVPPETGSDGDIDSDGDGLMDAEEPGIGTDEFVWDSDGDGMPDGWEAKFASTDPLAEDGDYAADGDVMAYALTNLMTIVAWNGTDKASATNNYILGTRKVQIPEGSNLVSLVKFGLYERYDYGGRDGLGKKLTEADVSGLKVYSADWAEVVLVHGQVYDAFGYNPLTANPKAFADGTAVNTKEFTALDKYLLIRYFAAIGFAAADEAKMNRTRDWATWTLKPGDADQNHDGVPDGWQLYVMFGPNGRTTQAKPADAAVTPFDFTGKSYDPAQGDDDGLPAVYEYDFGTDPTDPWNAHTFDYDDPAVTDAIAWRFRIKPSEQLEDYDNDGLSNWAEYLAWKAGYGEFDVNDAYSVKANVLDYFVTVQDGPCKGWYVGEALDGAGTHLIADHDFVSDLWEDAYGVRFANRYVYDPQLDADGDGWSNYAESRVGTDPSRLQKPGIDATTVDEYPVPTVRLSIPYTGTKELAGSVVIKAYSEKQTRALADATWELMLKAEAVDSKESNTNKNEKMLGSWRNGEMHFTLSPSSIEPGSVAILAKDPGFKFYTTTWDWDYGYFWDNEEVIRNLQNGDMASAKWDSIIYDMPREGGDMTVGDLIYKMGDGEDTKVVGSVNYETGMCTIDFSLVGGSFWTKRTELHEQKSEETSENWEAIWGWLEYTYSRTDLTKSYFKAQFSSRFIPQGANQQFYLTEAADGYLREGLNTFVAFADLDGNGAYDDGEPYGIVRNVNVGWDMVTDLSIGLTDESSVFPRLALPGAEEGAEAKERVRIIRTAINGTPTRPRTVWAKKIDLSNQDWLTERDLFRVGEFDLDWKALTADAKALADLAAADITSADYEVYVGTNLIFSCTKEFTKNRTVPTAVSPTEDKFNKTLTAQPEFMWTGPEGCSAFVLQIAKDKSFAADTIVYDSGTNYLPAATVDGYRFRPAAYVGAELEDGKTYYWHVAELNAKFTSPAGGWSETASFETAVNTSNANTGYGRLAAEVRYFGPATNTLDCVVVGVYPTADFASQPVARKRLSGAELVSTLTNDQSKAFASVATNVVFEGIAPGDWYVMAFIDVNTNGVRDAYETWGYVCKIATESADLWSPVATTVVSTKTALPRTLLVMEDTDVNQNMAPDCTEDFSSWNPDAGSVDSDGDGLTDAEEDTIGTDADVWDTDGDGMPDGWEEVFAGTNPIDPDGDEFVAGDVMAYALTNVMLVTTWDGDSDVSATNIYIVADWKADWLPEGTNLSALASFGIYRTYDYGNVKGWGRPATTQEIANVKAFDTRYGDVALVHSQVYGAFGYDTLTANPKAFADGTAANTKEFTNLDKYLLVRYFREIGFDADEAKMNLNRDWATWTLKPGDPDTNHDGIADGWQLYVMFGPGGYTPLATPDKAAITPFDFTGKSYNVTIGDADGLAPVYEYDGGYYPTDPWSVDTDNDGISDAYAYAYRLKGERYREDDDNDGLSNFQEFLSSVALSELLGTPVVDADRRKTYADQMVPDYFLRVGSLYLGEIIADHDFVEDWLEDDEKLFSGDRKASRYRYDAHEDTDGNGWDNWSEARAYLAAGTYTAYDVVTNGAEVVSNAYEVSNYTGRPTPTGRIKVVYNGERAYTGNIVVQAYRYRDGAIPPMTVAADTTWTLPAGDTSAWYELGVSTNGYVCGGKNMFVVYNDADASGTWTPGEPYGIVSEVEVGFEKIADSAVEITDVNPSIMRIDLVNAAANNDFDSQVSLNDRGVNSSSVAIQNETVTSESFNNVLERNNYVRVRVVRLSVNGKTSNGYSSSIKYAMDTVMELFVDVTTAPFLTERALAQVGLYDLDWGNIKTVGMNMGYGTSAAEVGDVVYGIVIGDDVINNALPATKLNIFATTFVNAFEAGKTQLEQTAATPESVEFAENGCRPTFLWKHEQSVKDYPAFRLRVWDADTTPVYDSGVQRAPVRGADGTYRWTAPVYVGDKLENGKSYTFSVSMLDAKFTTPNKTETKYAFIPNANGIGGDVSDQYSILTAVKYFGPAETNKTIRVEAFESPDFVGLPASATYVRNCNYLMSTNSVTLNAQLIGLEPGKPYYVRAFIDTNTNGVKDVTESWGYGNYVDSDRKDLYTPRAYVAKKGSFQMPEAVVYIEDVDRNNDGIPDARADLTAPKADSPYIVTYAGGTAKPIATNVFKAMGDDAALLPFVSQLHSFENGDTFSSFQLYYAMAQGNVPSVDQLKTESDVRVTSFSLEDGIKLAISTRTTIDGKTLLPKVSGLSYSVKIKVKVEFVDDLTGGWEPLGETDAIEVSVNAVSEEIDAKSLKSVNAAIAEKTDGKAGFFKVSAEVAE